MANIPRIHQSSPLYSRFKRQEPRLHEADTLSNEQRVEPLNRERRHQSDRRRRNVRVLLERRNPLDRRNKKRAPLENHPAQDAEPPIRKGGHINTTA